MQLRYLQNNFGFLRLSAAMLVVYAHLNIYGRGTVPSVIYIRVTGDDGFTVGTLGVSVFFMLSGYLIAESWHNSPDFRRFLLRRVLRLYPAFLACYMLMLVLALALAGTAPAGGIGRICLDLLMFQTVALPPVFDGNPVAGINRPLWTLPVEFALYLVTAAVGLSALYCRWRILAVAPLLLLLPLFGEAFLDFTVMPSNGGEPVFRGSHLFAVASYIIGSLYFHLLYHRRVGGFLSLAAVAVIVAVFINSQAGWWPHSVSVGLHYLFFPPLLFYLARDANFGCRGFERFGDYSYGVYLYHWPVMQTVLLINPSFPLFCVISLVATAALAMLSWNAVERRAIALGKRNLTWA